MSVIIRLQNLPWTANAMDIRRFFYGLQIPDGGVHIVGGDKGDAFIAFSTDEDARQAMLLDGGRIGDCDIKLFLSSKTEMQTVIQKARESSTSESCPKNEQFKNPLQIETATPFPTHSHSGAFNESGFQTTQNEWADSHMNKKPQQLSFYGQQNPENMHDKQQRGQDFDEPNIDDKPYQNTNEGYGIFNKANLGFHRSNEDVIQPNSKTAGRGLPVFDNSIPPPNFERGSGTTLSKMSDTRSRFSSTPELDNSNQHLGMSRGQPPFHRNLPSGHLGSGVDRNINIRDDNPPPDDPQNIFGNVPRSRPSDSNRRGQLFDERFKPPSDNMAHRVENASVRSNIDDRRRGNMRAGMLAGHPDNMGEREELNEGRYPRVADTQKNIAHSEMLDGTNNDFNYRRPDVTEHRGSHGLMRRPPMGFQGLLSTSGVPPLIPSPPLQNEPPAFTSDIKQILKQPVKPPVFERRFNDAHETTNFTMGYPQNLPESMRASHSIDQDQIFSNRDDERRFSSRMHDTKKLYPVEKDNSDLGNRRMQQPPADKPFPKKKGLLGDGPGSLRITNLSSSREGSTDRSRFSNKFSPNVLGAAAMSISDKDLDIRNDAVGNLHDDEFFFEANEMNKQNFEGGRFRQEPDLCRRITNLPLDVSFREIRRLFGRTEIPRDGLKLINDDLGQRVGVAYIRFGSIKDADDALSFDGTRVRDRIINVGPTSAETFNIAVDSYHPNQFPQMSENLMPEAQLPNAPSMSLGQGMGFTHAVDSFPPEDLDLIDEPMPYQNELMTSLIENPNLLPDLFANKLSNQDQDFPENYQMGDTNFASRVDRDHRVSSLKSQDSDGHSNGRISRSPVGRGRPQQRSPSPGRSRFRQRSPRRRSPVRRARSRSPVHSRRQYGPDELTLLVKNLPKRVIRKDIRDFFRGYKIARKGDAVHIEVDRECRDTGCALIEFEHEREFGNALKKHNQRMSGHTLGVYPLSKKEYKDRIEKSRDYTKKQKEQKKKSPSAEINVKDKDNDETKDNNEKREATKAPLLQATKAPLLQATKAPLLQATKAPLLQATKAPLLQATKAPLLQATKAPLLQATKAPLLKTDLKTQHGHNIDSDRNCNKEIDTVVGPPVSTVPIVTEKSPPKIMNWADEVEKEEQARNETCVRLNGLPYSCTVNEVEMFFKSIKIVLNGIHLFKLGPSRVGPVGFVEFVDSEECKNAVFRNNGYIGKRYITVIAMKKELMLEQMNGPPPAAASAPPPRLINPPRPPLDIAPPGCAIQVSNVPFHATLRDIAGAFAAFRPVADEIRIRYGPSGKPTGDALIPFHNDVDAKRAFEVLNNQVVLGRTVSLTIV